MTRKSNKKLIDDDELQAAIKNPNATIHYNHDGTYNIEYKEPSPEPVVEDLDYSDQMYNVHLEIVQYCRQQGLCFLDHISSFANFCNLINDFIDTPENKDTSIKTATSDALKTIQ